MTVATKDRFTVGSADWIRAEAREAFASTVPDIEVYVRDLLPGEQVVILERTNWADGGPEEGQLLRSEYTVEDGEIQFSDPEPASIEYVAKARRREKAGAQVALTGPIVFKDAPKHIAEAAVLVPGEEDADGEVLSAAKIEDVAHEWLGEWGMFDVQHAVKDTGQALPKTVAMPVESYIEREDRTVKIGGEEVVLPKGTWTVAVKAADDEIWGSIESGALSGMSIMGVKRDDYDTVAAALKSADSLETRRITLAEAGGGDPNGDWFCPVIGLVDEPAVPKAKFFALKRKEKPGLLARVFKSTGENEMDKQEFEQAMSERDETIAGLRSEIEDIRSEIQTEETEEVEPEVEETEDQEEDPTEEEATTEELVAAAKAELQERLDATEKRLDAVEKKRTPSRVLGEQDGTEGEGETEDYGDRDAYGRRKRD